METVAISFPYPCKPTLFEMVITRIWNLYHVASVQLFHEDELLIKPPSEHDDRQNTTI
jgi:hypothetical protein